MKLLIFVMIVLVSCHSRKPTKLGYSKDYLRETRNWEFFKLNDTLDGLIIDYIPSFGCRSAYTTTSISIIQTENETYRLLSESCDYEIEIGDSIRIIPLDYPRRLFKKYHQGIIMIYEEKNGKATNGYLPDQFYHFPHIRKTTYGQLETNG